MIDVIFSQRNWMNSYFLAVVTLLQIKVYSYQFSVAFKGWTYIRAYYKLAL